MDHSSSVQMEQAHADLIRKVPQVTFCDVKALFKLVLKQLLDVTTLCKLNHNVDTVAFPYPLLLFHCICMASRLNEPLTVLLCCLVTRRSHINIQRLVAAT